MKALIKEDYIINVYNEEIPSCLNLLDRSRLSNKEKTQHLITHTKPLFDQLNNLLVRLVWDQWLTNKIVGENVTSIDQIKERLKLAPRYDKWLTETLAVFQKYKLLRLEHNRCIISENIAGVEVNVWDEWTEKKKLWLSYPDLEAHVKLIDEVILCLPQIISGQIKATDVLFPDSSMELIEGIYKKHAIADYFNDVLAETVVSLIQKRKELGINEPLRIIEIGAGTGGTTATVLPKINPFASSIGEYCYTDLSKAFLIHAKETFGKDYPFMTYEIFDVSQSILQQAVESKKFDIVIATNVLHATKNIKQTLRNAKAKLKKNGLFIINELTENTPFLHLTFGLLDGWWLYEDSALRLPGCPGLSIDTWKNILKKEGFNFITTPAQDALPLRQQILAAESDGIVRIKSNVPDHSQKQKGMLPEKKGAIPVPNKIQSNLLSQKEDTLKQRAIRFFTGVVAETVRLTVDRIDPLESFENYGIDSILVVQLSNSLRKYFKKVSSTLFFENKNIDELSDHFIKENYEELSSVLGFEKTSLVNENIVEKQNGQEKIVKVFATQNSLNEKKAADQIPAQVASKGTADSVMDIAIIGMSGKFPMADTIGEFWNNILEGKNCITTIPDRWDWKKYYHEERNKEGYIYTKWGGFINDIDKFDPLFFQIAPAEAEKMDPQERLFLQEAYRSMQDAGYTPAELAQKNKMGVFVGVMNFNYASGTNYWSIANRVSYLFDFQGPSLAVDTACSSSLTAIHLAVESLRNGNSTCAIAGGVNLITSIKHQQRLSVMTMVSAGNKNRAFGAGADGFVDGEAIVSIVLKPLNKAKEDGDHIYGLIKGSSINAGGRTSGYTVPNPKAQADLITEAMQNAKVNAREISYIEAHGTGTLLGDPIEIAGLTRSFRQFTGDKQFCAIGSTKSNIGHCESAAGIAGLVKVIYQMMYRKLVPSLHTEELNKEIDFEDSPFKVQRELADWNPLILKKDRWESIPRIAGLSSFGAGGTNVHLILQEYIAEQKTVSVAKEEFLMLLSAKNEEQLKKIAEDLLKFIQLGHLQDSHLAAIAYTLQSGREAMDERLVIIADSLDLFKDSLKNYLEGIGKKNIIFGRVTKEKNPLFKLFEEGALLSTITSSLAEKKWSTLAELWVNGAKLSWENCGGTDLPQKISLPTYPFAKKKYWLNPEDYLHIKSGDAVEKNNNAKLHPLVQENTSDLKEQKFTSIFTGNEFFLNDHQVKDQSILPGAAYLEMAREAITRSLPDFENEQHELILSNIHWIVPVNATCENTTIHITVATGQNGQFVFEIYSGKRNSKELYCKGNAVLSIAAPSESINSEALKEACNKSVISRETIYEAFKKVGINYGAAYQTVEKVWVGEKRALAKLKLNDPDQYDLAAYDLHPGLIDGAMHSAIAMLLDLEKGDHDLKPLIAAQLEQIKIYGSCTQEMWACLTITEKEVSGATKLDITIADKDGHICFELIGFKLQPINANASPKALIGCTLLAPVFKKINLQETDTSIVLDGLTFILSDEQVLKEKLSKSTASSITSPASVSHTTAEFNALLTHEKELKHIYWLLPSTETTDLIQAQEIGILNGFRLMKSLIDLGYSEKDLRWTVITKNTQPLGPYDQVNPAHAGLHGFLGSMANEFHHWKIRIIDVDGEPEHLNMLNRIPFENEANPWVNRNNQWFRQSLVAYVDDQKDTTLYKEGAVYVAIGGAGGIGKVWTAYIVEHFNAKVVWIGRRQQDQEITNAIAEIGKLGTAPVYLSADASKKQELEKVKEIIDQQFGTVNGVIHTAVGALDKSLLYMDEQLFRAGLSSKINISVELANVFEHESLDFVLFFSSMTSFVTPHGQTSYVAGSVFKDAFATHLDRIWKTKVKVMNWGFWGSEIGIGSVVPEVFRNRLLREGQVSITPAEGMEAINSLLNSSLPQLGLMKTSQPLTMKKLDSSFRLSSNHSLAELSDGWFDAIKIHSAERNEIEKKIVPFRKSIDEMMALVLWAELNEMGIFSQPNGSVADILASWNFNPWFGRWMDETMRVLVRFNFIQIDKGQYAVLQRSKIHKEDVWNEWHKRKLDWINSGKKAEVMLVEATLKNISAILKRKVVATDIMFPNSSMDLVEGIYKNNELADYYNEVLSRSLLAYVKARTLNVPGEQLRILEIGAGTGGTSAHVLKSLEPYKVSIAEYCYTDLSKAFLIHAEQQYGPGNPFLSYKIIDISQDIEKQGIQSGTFDIVIAANVLHATNNISATLRNVKSALKNNGILLLNELSENLLFTHLTFGFLDGWWFYEDAEVRVPGCPVLNPESWKKTLAMEGFKNVTFPDPESKPLGQQIIIATSNGVRFKTVEVKETKRAAHSSFSNHKPEIKAQSFPKDKNRKPAFLKAAIIKIISDKVVESLKVEPEMINIQESFSDYGLDSILGVRLIHGLNQAFQLSLDTTLLFDHASIQKLAEYLFENYNNELSRLLQMDEQVVGKNESAESDQVDFPERFSSRFNVNAFDQNPVNTNAVTRNQIDKKKESKDIAIIGLSGRFAKSDDVEALWENLIQGKNLVTEVSRWDLSAEWEKGKSEGINYCRKGGFMDQIDVFDPLFFNISGLEATYTDPQQRIFLEEAWSALEDAGYAGDDINGKSCGVYVGCGTGDYQQLINDRAPVQSIWGNINSIIPARIAYHLNLQGPAIAVDTACSSSLVAIHLACQSLWNNEIKMAIAGGVYVQSTPEFMIKGSRGGMLSPTGTCYTFDERADGFVTGEGAGVVILKKLEEAIRDKDHIYGVIIGTGVNQDGSTNGITAPSAASQARLEKQVYDAFNIHPSTIQMVEAHGTATKLGDPIEVSALTNVFKKYTDQQNYCALGSIKSNVGHLTSAAGVAGLVKILMSFKYKKIPPTINFNSINANIKLEHSPFYVNTALKDWSVKEGEKRRAALSSFGLSGTNAHMVLEEYTEQAIASDHKPAGLFILSTRSKEQLIKRCAKMIRHCENNPDLDMDKMSFTLLAGHRHHHHRIVLVARNQTDLISQLKNWVVEGERSNRLFYNELPENGVTVDPQVTDQVNDYLHTIHQVEDHTAYENLLVKIAEQVSKGFALKYEDLYKDHIPGRMSLPAYPFAKEKYWVNADKPTAPSNTNDKMIHPLIQRNVSDFSGLKFASRFTGKESFLRDHQINGKSILPGVAYLEMAKKAHDLAFGGNLALNVVRLKNIIWAQPIIVNGKPVDVETTLKPQEGGQVTFEISNGKAAGLQTKIFSRGSIEHSLTDAVIPAPLNMADLRIKCSDKIIVDDCYHAFESMGIQYGTAHKGLKEIALGHNQLIAKVEFPINDINGKSEYLLHPSVLDAALQTTIAFKLKEKQLKAALPFALDQVNVYALCSNEMWIHTRIQMQDERNEFQKFDIDVCDKNGNIAIQLVGLNSRELVPEKSTAMETMLFEPVWVKKNRSLVRSTNNQYHALWLVDLDTKGIKANEVYSLSSAEHKGHAAYQHVVLQLLQKIQHLINLKTGQTFIQLILPSHHQMMAEGLVGMLRTAAIEKPDWSVQCIVLDKEITAATAAVENTGQADNYIKYTDGEKWLLEWQEINPEQQLVPWKDNGIYFISGGAGGIGKQVAMEIARKVNAPKIVLTGRSVITDANQQLLDELAQNGAEGEYIQCDVSNKEALSRALTYVKIKFKGLNGIIHSAGVTNDGFLLNKSAEALASVFSPKVNGTIYLDELTADLNLDFMFLFSSAAAVVGNIGQGDYAAANGFMDAFAEKRNREVQKGKRFGKTISINWPLLQDGGMLVTEETKKTMLHEMGMQPLSTAAAMHALEKLYGTQNSRVLVMSGIAEKIRTHTNRLSLNANKTENKKGAAILPAQGTGEEWMQQMITYLKTIFSQVVEFPVDKIKEHAPLDNYGIDSILIMKMTAILEKDFESLSKTLFFEYKDIQSLAAYFVKEHPEKLQALFGTDERIQDNQPDLELLNESTGNAFHSAKQDAKATNKLKDEKNKYPYDEIAIIGLAGRYPKSPDLETFWENLKNGKDCITEIPKDRWDHALYFDEDQNAKGKTYSKWGGFIDGMDEFDARFFNITPKEAQMIDPQERLFLQCVYEAIEDAGYTRQQLADSIHYNTKGNVGVYVGVMYEEYQLFGAQESLSGDAYSLLGSPSSIANRISYFCNFHGPCMAIDSMCSSSLTTIHLACQSLREEECEIAIAGGVNLSLHPNKYILLAQGKFASDKGRCESFGKGGNGYVPGEGVGAVILKPLRKALADGDQIYGLVKGTAINHGGKNNGFTVPNPIAQADVILKAYQRANVSPEHVTYIEAHGTGTSLGDPIEIAGLSKAFQMFTSQKQYCAIGSVKSNIGHCESAAGVGGVTKVLLQLKHKTLVPSLHSDELNKNILFEQSPFIVQQKLQTWKRPVKNVEGRLIELPRTGGISSFGAGGSNAHVIIQEYIPQRSIGNDLQDEPVIIVISALKEKGLVDRCKDLHRYLEKTTDHLSNIAFTLQVGREALAERIAFVVRTKIEFKKKLEAIISGSVEQTDVLRGTVSAYDIVTEEQNRTDSWYQSKKLSEIAGFWIKGGEPAWEKLYAGRSVNRISLPTYPFEKEKHWRPKRIVKASEQIVIQQQADSKIATPEKNFQPEITLQQKISLVDLAHVNDQFEAPHIMNGGKVDLESLVPVQEAPQRLKDNAVAKNKSVINDLKESLSQALLLPIEELTEYENFDQLGVDSIVGVEWINAINTKYALNLQSAAVYNYPNIEKLAAHVSGLLNPEKAILIENITKEVVVDQKTKLETYPDVQKESILDTLKQKLAASLLLPIDELGEHVDFGQLGVDSIVGIEWIQSINHEFKLGIQASTIYEYPTMKLFTDYLYKLLTTGISTPATHNSEPESLESLLEKVKFGKLDINKANQLIEELIN